MYLRRKSATPNESPESRIAVSILMGLTFASFGSTTRGPEAAFPEDLRFLAIASMVLGYRMTLSCEREKIST